MLKVRVFDVPNSLNFLPLVILLRAHNFLVNQKLSDMNDKLMGIVGVFVCLPWFTTKPARDRG